MPGEDVEELLFEATDLLFGSQLEETTDPGTLPVSSSSSEEWNSITLYRVWLTLAVRFRESLPVFLVSPVAP